MQLFGYDQWAALFEQATDKRLARGFAALAPDSRLSIDAQVEAYSKLMMSSQVQQQQAAKQKPPRKQKKAVQQTAGGEQEKGGDPIASALRSAMNVVQPQLVGRHAFQGAIAAIAAHIHDQLLLPGQGDLVFVAPTGIKSNLWLFLLIMRALDKKARGGASWRKRVWLGVLSMRHRDKGDEDANAGPKRPVHMVLTDDCLFSGSQLQHYAELAIERLAPEAVTLCPAFSTTTGLFQVTSNLPSTDARHTSVFVPGGLFGYRRSTAEQLAEKDVALCFRLRGRWLVLSLFATMGLVRTIVRLHPKGSSATQNHHHHMWGCGAAAHEWTGKALIASTSAVGHTATVFQHKLADEVSVPTQWLLLGPTARHAVAYLCGAAPCNLDEPVALHVLPFEDVLEQLDARLAAEAGQQGKERFMSLPFSSGGFACEAGLLSPGCQPRKVVLSKMPMFAPVLQPMSACGKEVQAIMSRGDDPATSQPWDLSAAEGMTYMKGSQSAATSTCVDAPYKAVLKELLTAVAKGAKGGSRLCAALGFSEE